MEARKYKTLTLLTVGLLGLVIGIAVSRFWQSRETPDSIPASSELPPSQGTDSSDVRSAGTVSRFQVFQDTSIGEPLPPSSAPVREVLAQLDQRARNGEAKAACRVAYEKSLCSTLPKQRLQYEQWLASSRRGIDLMDPKHIKQYTERIEFQDGEHRARLAWLTRHCASVDGVDASESMQLWRRAALLGSPYAAKRYASGRIFKLDSMLVLSGQLAVWRSEAPRLAFSAAEQGDLAMTLVLAGALSPYPDGSEAFLAQAVEQDGPLSLALFRRAHRALVAAYSRVNDPEDEYFIASQTKSWDIQRWIDDLSYFLGPEGVQRADELERTQLASWQPITVSSGVTNMSSWGYTSVRRATECGKTQETER